jgi:hypothetical protein
VKIWLIIIKNLAKKSMHCLKLIGENVMNIYITGLF